MSTKFDLRQAISKDTLDQIANNVANEELDDLVRAINSELTLPLRMKASTPVDLILNIDNILVINPEHNRNRTIPPISGILPSFTSGTVEFPSTSGGNVIVTPGTDTTLTLTNNNYIKCAIVLNSSGDLVVAFGTEGASESAATLPVFPSGYPIGYVVLFNNAGTIENVINSRIYQFVGGSSGGGASIAVLLNDVTVEDPVSVINFKGSVDVTNPSAGQVDVEISASGGGNYQFDILQRDEEDVLSTEIPNQIRDDFGDSDKGTKSVGMAQSQSALRLTGTTLTGDYERVKEVTLKMKNSEGIAVISLQALAPKNIAMSPSSTATSVDVVFDNDVSEFFPVNKDILICKKVLSDDVVIHRSVLNLDDKPARLEVSAVNYDDVADETTITIDNPDALDLDLDVASLNYNDQLRIIPFDFDFKLKSLGASSYEDMIIEDISSLQNIRISGENFLINLEGLTGSILGIHASASPNKTYMVARVIEDVTSDARFHWFYSVDSGTNWTKFSTTKLHNFAMSEEDSELYQYNNNSQIVVADNGKMFSTWQFFNASSRRAIHAVYSDLSAGTPVLSDTASNAGGTVGGNKGAGFVADDNSFSYAASVAADLIDLSFVAVMCKRDNSEISYSWFTDGGATFDSDVHVAAHTHGQTEVANITVTGTGVSHRTTIQYRATGIISEHADQGSTSFTNDNSTGANTLRIVGHSINNLDNHIAMYADSGTLKYLRATISGAPSYDSPVDLIASGFGMGADGYIGSTTNDSKNYHKIMNHSIIQNPSDDNHVLFIKDMIHPDGTARSTLFEISDVSNPQHLGISQYAASAFDELGLNSTKQQKAQTFTATASTTRLRTAAFRVRQIGRIGQGYTLSCALYGTSGGAPSGSPIASATNTYDPSLIRPDASEQWVFFNFDSISLSNGTTYALVLTKTFPDNASNHLAFFTGGNSYGGGNMFNYNGTTWSDGGVDLTFAISGEWISDIGLARDANTSPFGIRLNDQESQINSIDSNSAMISFRRVPDVDAFKPLSGSLHKMKLEWGNGTLQSTRESITPAGYDSDNFDYNLAYSIAPDIDESSRLNVLTGAADLAFQSEERSGFNLPGVYTNVVIGHYVQDPNFFKSKALYCDGTVARGTGCTVTTHSPAFQITQTRPFAIEVEINPDVDFSGIERAILGRYDTGASNGWYFYLSSGGFLSFLTQNSGGTSTSVIASDIIEPTYYHRIRITYDGTIMRLYRALEAPYTNFVEVNSYTTQQDVTTTNTTSSTFYVGRVGTVSAEKPFKGKIGYVKLSQGVNSFVYDSWRNQAPITKPANLGNRIIAERQMGQNSSTLGTNFDFPMSMSSLEIAQNTVVDSHDLQLKLSGKITQPLGTNMYLMITMNRGSSRNVSAIQGILFDYSK